MNKITLDEVTHIKPVTDEKKQENIYENKQKKLKRKKQEKSKEEVKKEGHIIDIYV